MRKLALLFSLLVLQFVAFSQEQGSGIVFQKLTFEEAKALSKQTGKPIFMDAYTVWCGPCKYLDKKVFVDEEVGAYFNKNFINIKVEMEKDVDGPMLAQKFKVRGYPTLLFINSEGQMIKQQVGALGAPALLDFGKSVK